MLVSAAGAAEWFPKAYAPYGTNATDHEYYLGLGREAVAAANSDVMGAKLLCIGERPVDPLPLLCI